MFLRDKRSRLKEKIKMEGMAEYCKLINACTTEWEQAYINRQEASRIESELIRQLALLEEEEKIKTMRNVIVGKRQEAFDRKWNATSDVDERLLLCKAENECVEQELTEKLSCLGIKSDVIEQPKPKPSIDLSHAAEIKSEPPIINDEEPSSAPNKTSEKRVYKFQNFELAVSLLIPILICGVSGTNIGLGVAIGLTVSLLLCGIFLIRAKLDNETTDKSSVASKVAVGSCTGSGYGTALTVGIAAGLLGGALTSGHKSVSNSTYSDYSDAYEPCECDYEDHCSDSYDSCSASEGYGSGEGGSEF